MACKAGLPLDTRTGTSYEERVFKVNGTTVMTKEQVGDIQLITFCASWAALYIGVRFVLLPQRSAVFCKHVVSLVHTAAAVLMSLRALRKEPFAHFGHQPTRDEVPSLLMFLAARPCVLHL